MVEDSLFTLAQFGMTDESIAHELAVSSSTVSRWRSGKSQPQPRHEGRLKRLANSVSMNSTKRIEVFEAAVDACLREMRESLHRHAKISSRNEALDAIAELFQAHVAAMRLDGIGLSNATFTSDSSAQALHDFLNRYSGGGRRLSNTLFRGGPDPKSWRESDEHLANEIIDAFDRMNYSTSLVNDIERGGDLLNLIFGRFLADSFQDEKELGQYLTPTEVVQFMVELALLDLDESEVEALSNPDTFHNFGYVLDPSCGVGSFLAEFVRAAHPKIAPESSEWSSQAASKLVIGADKSDRMVRLAKANLALFGSGNPTLIQGNSLAREGKEASSLNNINGQVGLILTNPPFGATFSGSSLQGYSLSSSWASKSYTSIDSELLFLERYLDWLRPGGQLLAIVPDSILTNKGIFGDLRNGLKSSVELKTIISLPPITFAAAGTATKTSIIHLRKQDNPRSDVRFAICNEVGYSVTARGSQRRKIFEGTNELSVILNDLKESNYSGSVRFLKNFDESGRWDATYNASLPREIEMEIDNNPSLLRISEVCTLSQARLDPRKLDSATFQYIEISDVDGSELSVSAKETQCDTAPSRARMLVHEGDIIVSTVRPERRTLGVVPSHLDGAICSTGFAVLKADKIEPLALAALLQTDFVVQQMLRNNIGIAYPAIESKILPTLVLPVNWESLPALNEAAKRFEIARNIFENEKINFFTEIKSETGGLMANPK